MPSNTDYLNDINGSERGSGLSNNQLLENIAGGGGEGSGLVRTVNDIEGPDVVIGGDSILVTESAPYPTLPYPQVVNGTETLLTAVAKLDANINGKIVRQAPIEDLESGSSLLDVINKVNSILHELRDAGVIES